MSVYFLAGVTQVTRAIATSEPCTFDASHASIADCGSMDKGRKVCCDMHEDQTATPRNRTSKKKTTFGVVGLGSIWQRASWKLIAEAVLEQVR